MTCSNELTVSRPGYTWGVLWELIRIHRLDPNQGITPGACRNLIGTNATVGPNVKFILLETKLEESSILGKAERDAQVRRPRPHSAFPRLTVVSLHGNALTLRSRCMMIPLPASRNMAAG